MTNMKQEQPQSREKFNSNFGFLMVVIGSAVGLGNLWGFPYKMGKGGGFAFLLLYLLLAIAVGYTCMIGEVAIGRKSGQASIGAFRAVDHRFTFAGWFGVLAQFFLLPFYFTLGGYCIKYLVTNIGDIFHAGFGLGSLDSGTYFAEFTQDKTATILYSLLFIILTVYIVLKGVSGGLEKFSTVAMPALFFMLIIIVFRSCTLPGAGEGLAFIFKPDLSVFKGTGWIKILASAGGQMFFSLSLASGSLTAFGSYLDKKENIEKNAIIVPIADTAAALLASMATMPAVFAMGMEPASGPGMLFVTLQGVFSAMGSTGPIFGSIFYLLVVIAALSSSIAMLEGTVSALIDRSLEKGGSGNRRKITLCTVAIMTACSLLITADALGEGGLPHLFGFQTWLDTFDLFAEGFLMPVGCICMSIMLGWLHSGYIDDEVLTGSRFKSRRFVNFSLKWISPLFVTFVLFGQLDGFFNLGLFS